MNPKTILMVIILLLASGCPSSTNFNPNAGAVIQDLSFDMPKVYDSETTSLMFDVANVGGKEIPKDGVKVYVYGPKIGNGAKVWRLKNSNPTATAKDGYVSTSISSLDLPPPNPSLGTPGGRQSFDLEFTPADVLDGTEVQTEFHVSLCYPYTTEVLSQIEVVSKNELRATSILGSRKDSINAGGPIQISVEVEKNLVAGRKIPIILRVTDVGGGYPLKSGTDCDIDTETENRHEVNVALTVDGSAITCDSPTVTLTKGKGALFCVYDSTQTGTPRRTYMIRATAEYKYYTTSTTTITNIGSSL